MAPLRPDLTSVRRAVGVAAVSFLLSGSIVYLMAPSFLNSGSSPGTTANPAPTRTVTESATPGRLSSSAGPTSASDTRRTTSSTTPGTGDSAGTASAEEETIQVEAPADSAKPFQTVPISGTYHGGADTLLRLQRWEGGRWRTFPLSAKTDGAGRFTAYVEMGQPGLHWLRVRDPGSGVKSKSFLLVVRD